MSEGLSLGICTAGSLPGTNPKIQPEFEIAGQNAIQHHLMDDSDGGIPIALVLPREGSEHETSGSAMQGGHNALPIDRTSAR